MDTKPQIGITLPTKGNRFAFFFIKLNLWIQGAKAIPLYPDKKQIDFNYINGVILSGGNDIDPTLYGADHNAHNTPLDTKRDQFELDILEKAYTKRLPILGICRGAQLINIYFKGDLYPTILDLDQYLIHQNSIFPIKNILIKKFSNLFSIVRKTPITANSIHNQAIKTVGEKLTVSATHKKIIEAIEKTDYPFLLGVQWHPEYLFYFQEERNIFKEFVNAANINKKENK